MMHQFVGSTSFANQLDIVRVVIDPWKKARATRVLIEAEQMADIPFYAIPRWSRSKNKVRQVKPVEL